MSIFYLDHELGNDANNGSTWALAWKTITSGATAARIAPGDTIRIAKSPAPARIGASTCKWTSGPLPGAVTPGSSTNATPIVVTKTAHGFVNGDIVQVVGHTTNTNANGVWLVANKTDNTFELAGSVGNGTGGATGTLQLINAKAVVLDAAVAAKVDDCEVAWTANGSGDITVARTGISVDAKQGDACMKFTFDATPQTSTMQAYKATGDLTLSGYQKISFWIKTNAVFVANNLVLCLCSNADGTGVVDTFNIPAIPSQARWLPLTLSRVGGGNLGSSTIKSISINTGSVAPEASVNFLLDNIVACTTDGLNLQSLISKTSAEQGGVEGRYGIQSIDGTIVLLDNETNTKADAGRGYYGTSESVATYKRETVKTAMAAGSSTAVQAVQDKGTYAASITFSGGWNISSTEQDGETIFDGLNGNGYGLTTTTFNAWSHVALCRYSMGFFTAEPSIGGTYTDCGLSNCTNYGFYISSSYDVITRCCSRNDGGFGFWCVGKKTLFVSCTAFGSFYSTAYLSNAKDNIFRLCSLCNAGSGSGALNGLVCPGLILQSCTLAGNAVTSINVGDDDMRLYDCVLSDTTECNQQPLKHSYVYSQNHDNTAGNHQIFTYQGRISSDATTRHTASGLAWKMAVTGSARHIADPVILKLARVYLVGGQAATIKAFLKKTHATDTEGAIRCRNVLVSAVYTNYQSSAMAANTDWQELTLTFTPDNTGVYDIEALAWWVANTADESVYVDDMTLPTGVATATLDIVADAQPWCQNAPAGGGTPVTTAYAFIGG